MKFLENNLNTILPIRWLRNTRIVVNLIGSFHAGKEANKTPQCFAVLVMPWLGTDVPWFSIVFGLFLARKGNDVVFVVDNIPFGDNPIRYRFILWCVTSVLTRVAKRHKVMYLSGYASPEPLLPAEIAAVNKLASFNSIWALKGETSRKGRKRYTDIVISQLSASYAAVKALIAANSFDAIFIPGGVYSSSGVWEECAAAAGIRVASYDGGAHGVLLICSNGIAAQLQDIPRAFAMLKNGPDFDREKQAMTETALEEMRRRRAGTDKFSSQQRGRAGGGLKFNKGVLIALNSSWDSAALGLHVVFDNSAQWIVDTTRWLLDSTDSDIVIRQHPVERLDIARTSDDYSKLLSSNFGNNPRVHFIAATDLVNTYDLLNAVETVVVYTSTIGTEAAALGKVVVTPSKSYYSALGFVWNADSRETYFKHLSNAVQGRYAVTPSMKEDAVCCYYLTQCCNWIASPFNPGDFNDWGKYDLEKLYGLASVQLSLAAIQNNVPAAILNHRARSRAACEVLS